jgi:hypothetical protein
MSFYACLMSLAVAGLFGLTQLIAAVQNKVWLYTILNQFIPAVQNKV